MIFAMLTCFCRQATGGKRHSILMLVAAAGSISSKTCLTKVVEKIACLYANGGNTKRDYNAISLSNNNVAFRSRYADPPKISFTSRRWCQQIFIIIIVIPICIPLRFHQQFDESDEGVDQN